MKFHLSMANADRRKHCRNARTRGSQTRIRRRLTTNDRQTFSEFHSGKSNIWSAKLTSDDAVIVDRARKNDNKAWNRGMSLKRTPQHARFPRQCRRAPIEISDNGDRTFVNVDIGLAEDSQPRSAMCLASITLPVVVVFERLELAAMTVPLTPWLRAGALDQGALLPPAFLYTSRNWRKARWLGWQISLK